MATAIVNAAVSAVGKALAPLTGSLLKDWAASMELGDNVNALELELLSVKAILEHTARKEIVDNRALSELLVRLQDLGYDAEDVLDELDYFRIQDELHGTSDAADKHPKGCVPNLALNVRHTGKAVGKRICWLPACAKREARNSDDSTISSPKRTIQQASREKLASRVCNTIVHVAGKCFPCSSLSPARDDEDDDDDIEVLGHNYESTQSSMLIRSFFEETGTHINSWQQNQTNYPPNKLSFNRVDASTRMRHIVEQLKVVREDVSDIIKTLGPNWSAAPNIARLITNSESIEPKLYGRDDIMNSIIHDITQGKHSADEVLTVIPIVGPGGIGKTTLAQHIYHSREVQEHFDVKVWKCVSLNFDVNKLIEEIEKRILEVDGESSTDTAGELIAQRLKNKRFLLVLDDIWDCSSGDEWKRLLLPFKKSQVQGNIIIVTTRFPAQAQIMVQTIEDSISLRGLDYEEFKDLFLDFVFGDDQSRKGHTFLPETRDKIVRRLKGSPLAAKTVGRLLKNQLDLAHWTRVLESKEWEQEDGTDDIMPALKLSYDYLASPLQQCFYYCALFPQDYKFDRDELVNFWIGLDILHPSHGENKRVEDIGLSHLTQLVGHGFLENERKKDGSACYIIHDLLHELARKVSSHECLSIESSQSQLNSLQVLPSIRHLSININDTSIEGRLTLKNCVDNFKTLDKRLKVEKLWTLMLFGEHGCFVKAFGDLFREAKALRVIFLSKASYDVEDLLHSFNYLLHLRYLRIQSSSIGRIRFPSKLSRFYHMMVLDAKHCDIVDLPRDMSNLIKLRHFLVQHDATHSSIADVGKLKSLQQLRRFIVKYRYQGFELRQVGHLAELCGSLYIGHLERIQQKEEAEDAKLIQKSHLHELIFCWENIWGSTNDSTLEEHVLEMLKPSSNLLKLSIIGHKGATCPSWLGMDLSVESLESLCLDGVAWKTFPPIGELWLVNVSHDEISGSIPDKRFGNLRRLNFENITSLKKWAVHAPCKLFPFLEVLLIRGCSNLVELSFSHSACCQQEKVAYASLFPRLSQLVIRNCLQLLSFPPVPWTDAPCSIEIEGTGSSCLHKLVYAKNSNSEYCLTVEGKETPDSTVFDLLAFHNLTRLKELRMLSCQPMALHHLQMLSSLRTLRMSCLSTAFPFAECDIHAKYQFPVEFLIIDGWNASGKELTRLLTHFLKLSELKLWSCEKITGLSVMGQLAMAATRASSSANREDKEQTEQDAKAEETVALAAEGLLLLPPRLQELSIVNCTELRLLFNPLEDKEDGRTGQGGSLQGLSSLQRLSIMNCPKLLSYSSSSSSCFPFPNSLQYLHLEGMVGMETLEPLSNLSSLTSLSTAGCLLLRGEGLLSLVAQGCLTRLYVAGTPVLFFDPQPSGVQEQEHQSHSSKLQELSIDDVAAATVTPICSFLLSSLSTLNFFEDQMLESFTKEQEALLFVNSLEEISFMLCSRLQNLPERLHSLPNLKRLYIWECKALRELHGFPCSLQELVITGCPEIKSLPSLPSSLQKLVIKSCRRIDRLPKVDELPSSLREVDVRDSRSEELRRHCRELIGIIPIIRA
jgi:hypothetical protein